MEVFMKDNLRYTILYVRISKDDDAAGDSNSITTQLAILQKYASCVVMPIKISKW